MDKLFWIYFLIKSLLEYNDWFFLNIDEKWKKKWKVCVKLWFIVIKYFWFKLIYIWDFKEL